MSFLLDRASAEQAVALVAPMLEQARQNKAIGESGFLHAVIVDPARRPENSSFEDAILFEHSAGDRAKWDADYAAFARAKAKLAWRTGMSSEMAQMRYPHLLVEGDTLLWGSVNLDGIVVGVSGANPWYDEAFAGALAYCLRAAARARREQAAAAGHTLGALPPAR